MLLHIVVGLHNIDLLQCIPKLAFPGGCLVGCGAGFLNAPRLKGVNNGMNSALMAAEDIFNHLQTFDASMNTGWFGCLVC